MDGQGPHFLLASSFNRWYLATSGVAVVQDVLKVFSESELGIKISLEDRLLVSRHCVLFCLAR